ncbi:HNH endonuclease signature motif containing protein [Methylobacterium aquaticum]|jgi:HNH endonuclease|uniref:HNH endonuclease signature motif containing protein n=1 Tax=Methylobacterium aquaticum TaxID=270351 RepID=UPI003D17AAB8
MCLQNKISDRSKVDPSTGCWLWQNCRNRKGYGHIGHNGKTYLAHRLSYIAFVGDIPADMLVCHKCDRPACVNPDHLFLGTHADNVADRDSKGRHNPCKGFKHGRTKVTPEIIRSIRKDIRAQHVIASAHGVSEITVNRIRRGHRWGDVA